MSGRQIKDFFMNHLFVKSVSGAIIAGVLDHQVNNAGNYDMYCINKSLSFGAIVGGSIASAHYLAPSLTSHFHTIHDTALYSGKTLEHRLIEISLGSVAAIGATRLAFSSTVGNIINQIGIVVAADIAGEYISDYVNSQPLSYLQ